MRSPASRTSDFSPDLRFFSCEEDPIGGDSSKNFTHPGRCLHPRGLAAAGAVGKQHARPKVHM